MYSIIAFMRALAGKEPEVLTAMKHLADATQAEAGCKRFDVFLDKNNPRTLVFIEDYRDEAAFQDHLQMSYTKDALAQVADKTEGKPEIIWLMELV